MSALSAQLPNDLAVMLPEIILAVSAMLLLIVGVFRTDRAMGVVSALAVLAMVVAGYVMLSAGSGSASAFGGSFVADNFTRFAKVLILLGTIATLAMAPDFFKAAKIDKFEFPVLMLLSTVGMMLMVSANSFIALYMGLELQSLSLYVLASFHRDSVRSTEAGLKYFVLGALASGMMLYGISFIYGFTGTTQFTGVAAAIHSGGVGIGLIVGIVFLIVGLAFKITAVPFHMWAPDVYEGAPTPIAAFFMMSPKVAAMVLFVRTMLIAFPGAVDEWRQIIVVISVLSMALGAFAAIGQKNIKRMMAYSSIGHMGYALLGLAAGTTAGMQGVLIYLTFYLITNAGVFVCILLMKRDGQQVEAISDLAGLSHKRPVLAFSLGVMMFSLAGIPPLAGFFAKWYVFLAAIQAHLYGLAIIGVLASVVGAYYYLHVVKVMYFDSPVPTIEGRLGARMNIVLVASVVFTLGFVAGAAPLVAAATTAAQALLP